MDFSVMVCTWNNAGQLSRTLESLAHCDVPGDAHWELIVVNNHCTDRTDEVVDSFRSRLPLVYVHETKPGLSNARNRGLQLSRGQLVIFTDDDVRPGRNWIGRYLNAFHTHPSGRFWGGPIDSEFEGETPQRALLEWAPASVKGFDLGPAARDLDSNTRFMAANWACPKQGLDRVGRFNPRLGLDPSRKRAGSGEETDLMQRLIGAGWVAHYLPEARLTHIVPAEKVSLRHFGRRRRATGFNSAYADQHRLAEGSALGGIPIWIYRAVIQHWLRWLLAKATGRSGYREYLQWQWVLGCLDAAKWRIRKQGKACS